MTDSSSDWEVVGRANYVSFTSYRKDGSAVSTPVWIAPAEGKLYFFSEVGAYKVKRVRRNPSVTLQPCDVRGKTRPGAPVVEGTARVLDHTETPKVRKIVNRKYRLLGPLSEFGVWLTRRQRASFAIEIAPRQ
ncbi:PPOX class F420-dependent enzyme [Mycobacterium sp. 852013-50091_SCH5140682]|uniref:PPOX class F420-dependent oxidoreductase n=1 Tax=Mycobacterium sp. 852013-50091_SCH5140682 TaxID=1834109 RepID=UPI0007EAC810|nr:PPOX class F420-dependent oxidoreductase [Mycobacterium sp. 852013-50091_SCH5140682]OBC00523.1 PPOX class F420-dependent enzyme [Mycobacterium sp. 852013-50091_SCH5140682]